MVDEDRQQQQLVAEERGEGVVRRQEQRQGCHRGDCTTGAGAGAGAGMSGEDGPRCRRY